MQNNHGIVDANSGRNPLDD